VLAITQINLQAGPTESKLLPTYEKVAWNRNKAWKVDDTTYQIKVYIQHHILSAGIKYYVRDLLCDVNNYADTQSGNELHVR